MIRLNKIRTQYNRVESFGKKYYCEFELWFNFEIDKNFFNLKDLSFEIKSIKSYRESRYEKIQFKKLSKKFQQRIIDNYNFVNRCPVLIFKNNNLMLI